MALFTRSTRFPLFLSALLCCVFALSTALPAEEAGSHSARPLLTQRINDAAQVQLHQNAPPPAAAHAQDRGPIALDRALDLQLILKRSPEQQAALDTLNRQARTPGSRMYGQALTPAEFEETFGVSSKDISVLTAWLESKGLKVSVASSAQLMLEVHGTAEQVEHAFGVELHSYITAAGVARFANTGLPQIPAALAPVVQRIEGLQNFTRAPFANYDGPVAEAAATQRATAEKIAGEAALNPGWSHPMSAGALLTSVRNGPKAQPDTLQATTTTVALAPATVTFAAGTAVTVTATVAYSSVAPTGTVALSDSNGDLDATINISTCTLGTLKYTCTYNWTTATGGGFNDPDVVTATYSGDTLSASSSGTANLNENYGNGFFPLQNLTFTATPNTVVQGQTTQQALTVVIQGYGFIGAPTGSLFFWGQGAVGAIGEISDITTGCTKNGPVKYTCTLDWNPPATLAAGQYPLTASYSGDANYYAYQVVETTPFTVTSAGTTATTTTVSANPSTVYSGGTTFTTVTTWTGAGVPPTGSVALTGPAGTYGGGPLGAAVFPTTGNTSSSGSGAYDFGTYTYTYTCTTSLTAQTITCRIDDSDVYDVLPNNPGNNTVTAEYFGDATYKNSSGTTVVTLATGGFYPTSINMSASPTSVVFGSGSNVTYTIAISDEFALGTKPTGTLTLSGTPVSNSPVIIDMSTCTYSTTTYVDTCTITAAVPATTPAGNYTVTATYPGDANYSGSTGTVTVSVTGASPTSTTVTASRTNVNPNNPSTTLTSVTTYTGATTPTGTVTLTCAPGSDGSCDNLPAPENVSSCTLNTTARTFTCAITYALDTNDTAYGNYNLQMTYSGDVTYAGSSASVVVSDGGTIASTTTLVSGADPTTNFGVGPTESYTVNVKGKAGDGKPTGDVQVSCGTLALTTTAAQVSSTCTSTGASGSKVWTCPASGTYTIPATAPAGTYALKFQYSGDSTYKGSKAGTTLTINKASTPTAALSNVSSGYQSTITLTATDTGVSNTPPTGAASFTVNSVSVDTSLESCSASGAVETCTVQYTLPANLTANATYPMTAQFAADANYTASNTATATLTVTVDATTTTVTANPGSIPASGSSQVTATISNNNAAGINPTGTVTFTDTTNGTALGSCTLSNGSCAISVSGLKLNYGANTISASYGGVTNEFGASSGTGTVTRTTPVALIFSSVGHNFGSVVVGASTSGTENYGVLVTNDFTTDYTNFTINLTGSSEFTQQNHCPATLAVGASCEIVFTFSPTSTGAASASWSISGSSGFSYSPSNGGTLTGTGVSSSGVTLSTAGHNFGTVAINGKSSVYGTTLTNSTNASVSLSYTPVTSPFVLTATNCGSTLPAGQSCELEFDFEPTVTGIVQQVYGIQANGGATQITAQVNGTATPVNGITLTGTGQ